MTHVSMAECHRPYDRKEVSTMIRFDQHRSTSLATDSVRRTRPELDASQGGVQLLEGTSVLGGVVRQDSTPFFGVEVSICGEQCIVMPSQRRTR